MNRKKSTDWQICRKLLQLARPFWLHIGGMFVLSLLATPLSLLSPLPLKIGVDSLLSGRPAPGWFTSMFFLGNAPSTARLLFSVAALVVIIAVVGQIQEIASLFLSTFTSQRLMLRFRTLLFHNAQRLSLAYHDSKGTSDSTYRIQYDASAIDGIATEGVFPFLTSLITLIAMISVTMRLDFQLALVGLAVAPAMLICAHFNRRRMRGHWREWKVLESSALSVLQEALGAIRVVKAFGQEDHEERRFVDRAQQGMKVRLKITVNQSVYSFMIATITAVGTAAVLWVGFSHVRAGVLTLGNLLLVMAYLTRLYEPIRSIGKRSANLQNQLASAERALALLDQSRDVPDRPHARRLERATGRISFHDVSFGYESSRQVLRNLNFEVSPGARVGIAGRTGAGKTTLLSLLTRFYDPVDGQILLDGVDLRDYKLNDLRGQFAIVLQEPVLFSTTIGENIAYACPGAPQERIIAAAKAANAHDFITALPEGYDTLVGERGMRLSGGERQRISLARAFLKDAPILMLDEPTSSVDVKTEAAILEAMERLMKGRTTFMIAHRLSTLEKCDLRLEIEHGEVVVQEAGAGGMPGLMHTGSQPS